MKKVYINGQLIEMTDEEYKKYAERMTIRFPHRGSKTRKSKEG